MTLIFNITQHNWCINISENLTSCCGVDLTYALLEVEDRDRQRLKSNDSFRETRWNKGDWDKGSSRLLKPGCGFTRAAQDQYAANSWSQSENPWAQVATQPQRFRLSSFVLRFLSAAPQPTANKPKSVCKNNTLHVLKYDIYLQSILSINQINDSVGAVGNWVLYWFLTF